MTTEQKAKAYDEALERAKSALMDGTISTNTIAYIQDFFPELKESEDERVRKGLVKAVSGTFEGNKLFGTDVTREEALAWLEKQGNHKPIDKIQLGKKYKCIASPRYSTFRRGNIYKPVDNFLCNLMNLCYECFEPIEDSEQKPTDKTEPKFHEGDFIKHNKANIICKVISINSGSYYVENIDTSGRIELFNAEQNFHLWTIQDARDGDVLASELCDSIILFRGIKDDNIDFYCDYDFSKIDIPGDRFTVNNGQHYGNVEDSKDFYPATKEQRDTLFEKMKEAGYEWSDKDRKLIKIVK